MTGSEAYRLENAYPVRVIDSAASGLCYVVDGEGRGLDSEKYLATWKVIALTRKLLEQYLDICGELHDLDRMVTDSVSGSLPEPPYIQHTVSVCGIPYTERRARLEKQKVEIETFVESLPEAGLRRIVTYRAIEGLPWAQVAAKMGRRWSEEAVKKRYQRFFQKT